MTEEVFDTLIVGAGPAGLTAAYLLTKEGAGSVLVLEENARYVGGISRTECVNGYRFDIGGHRFFSKSQEVEELWRDLLPEDFVERPRISRIFYRGRFYSYPLRAFEALLNLGLLESALCLLSYAKARAFPNRHPRSFHEWVANQFGERLFGIFFKTYTEKVWGMSCDDISADWAAQRIKGLNLWVAIAAALRKSIRLAPGRESGVKTLIESFRYPRCGPGMIWETAARKVEELGGKILLGQGARRFDWDGEKRLWTVTAREADSGGERRYLARQVVSSAPMRDVVGNVTPRPASAAAAATLKYRDFLTVALFLESRPRFDDNWIYIHEPSVRVGRIQNYASWSPDMVPAADRGCLGMEYFCFEGDGLWRMADDDLVELATAELIKLGLAGVGQIAGGHVVRQQKAYPVYDDSYQASVDAVKKEFAVRFPTFHFVGRNGMHKYNNQDHAMMTAMLTVRNILAGAPVYDVWRVNEDAEYHEEVTAREGEAASGLRRVPQPIRP